MLTVEADEHRRVFDRLTFGHHRIGGKALIRPSQRDAFHDDLIVGYFRVLTHHGGAPAVDHGRPDDYGGTTPALLLPQDYGITVTVQHCHCNLDLRPEYRHF